MLVFSLVRAAVCGIGGARVTWKVIRQALSHWAVLAFILFGASVNVLFSGLAGYINPRDYLADVVAAHQFLKHETMYPRDLPQMGVVELAVPIKGRKELERVPVIRNDLSTLTDPPAPANPHPPMVGIALSAPVLLLGLRGSFVFVLLLSAVLLYVSVTAILRELFPPLPVVELCAVMGLVFAWYPVGATFRSGQPSIVLFALITGCWLMLRRNRPGIAGVAIGLAACLHAFPALMILYFAIRYRRALISSIGTITLLSLAAADLTIGETFRQWVNTVNTISLQFVPRPGNLSVAGLISSLLNGVGRGGNVNIIAPAVLLIIAGALLLFLWPWNRHNLAPERLDIEYSVFVAAMLLASPISWPRYLPIMLLPIAVLLAIWRRKRLRWAVPALLAALTCMSFPDSTVALLYNGLIHKVGFLIGWLAIAIPSFSIMAILLWVGFSARWMANLDTGEPATAVARSPDSTAI